MRDWLVIKDSMKNSVFASDETRNRKGYIPRDVAERLLCRDLSGTIWFSKGESALLRSSLEWCDTEPPGKESL
jgi:hypothetical protein